MSAAPVLDVRAFDRAMRGRERAHLQLIPGALEHAPARAHLPAHLATALAGFRRELHVRAFAPIHRAKTLRKATTAANEGYLSFCALWPSVIGIVVPWMFSSEEHARAVVDEPSPKDMWTSRRALGRLGAAACGRFAATYDARRMIAKTIVRWPADQTGPDDFPEEQFVGELFVADFALAFAFDVLESSRAPSIVPGLADWISEQGMLRARTAYGRIATPLYARKVSGAKAASLVVAKGWPPRQWDVWWADLRPGRKGEQIGKHNVLVVSNELAHSQAGVVLVAPITTTGSTQPFSVGISAVDAGIERDSWIQCHQVQALALVRERFLKRRQSLDVSRRGEVALAVAHVLRGLFPELDK